MMTLLFDSRHFFQCLLLCLSLLKTVSNSNRSIKDRKSMQIFTVTLLDLGEGTRNQYSSEFCRNAIHQPKSYRAPLTKADCHNTRINRIPYRKCTENVKDKPINFVFRRGKEANLRSPTKLCIQALTADRTGRYQAALR